MTTMIRKLIRKRSKLVQALEPFLMDDDQLKTSWAMVFMLLVFLYGVSVSGCAGWAMEEVSLTGRYDQTRYGLREYGTDGATGGEMTFTWRKKAPQ